MRPAYRRTGTAEAGASRNRTGKPSPLERSRGSLAIDEFAALGSAGRPASSDEIAAAIAYLASDDASFVRRAIFAVDSGRTAA
jgi:NAD(P)-dependent dehydrogenase (short-subunit alcohol dehydrogenase family)